MKRRFTKTLIALIMMCSFIVTSGPFAVQAKAAVNYDNVKTQAKYAADLLTSAYGVTSVQYALIDEGDIVLSGQSGVYDTSKTKALTKDNMYGIGSISKMFTTVAVMQLVEKGKVKLDSPVTKYIPEFKMADSRYKKITVRMLLNHSSGLMGSSYNNMTLFGDNNTLEIDNFLKNLSTQRLKADPGAFSVYCNDGFTLAQLLVEKVSGLSFTEYLNKNIETPAGMENTKTPYDDFDKEQLAKTYLPTSKDALPADSLVAVGAGGIYSTAEDLCRFAETFMENGNTKLLTDNSTDKMANAEYLNGLWCPDEDSIVSYGLGWDSVKTYPFTEYGVQALVKGGDTSFYHGSLIVLPQEDMAVAILSSGGSSTYNQVLGQELLLTALQDKGAIEKVLEDKTFEKAVKATMPSDMKGYAGYYGLFSGVIRIDISDDGVLRLAAGESEATVSDQKFIYTGDGKFYLEDGSAYLSFIKEDNGNTYLYVSSYVSLPGIGQLAISDYEGQKLEPVEISDTVKEVWKSRDSKRYFIINQLYSSQGYAIDAQIITGSMRAKLPGYFENALIIDENHAQMQLQIPGIYGRDLYDLEYYTKDKVEYMKAGDMLCISEDSINDLSTKSSFKVTIGKDGYAQWYTIGTKSKGKKIKVTSPKESSWSVYRSDGSCVYSSLINDGTTATLPSGGYIVFSGSKNAKFTVKYVN